MMVLIKTDLFITLFLKNIVPHNYFFNQFFSFFSIIGSAALVWLIFGILLVAFEEIKHHPFIFYLLSSLAITFFVGNVVIKNVVHRPRPYLNNQVLKLDRSKTYDLALSTCPKDFSFPSGHAATAAAAAAILSHFDKKRKLIYYLLALVIAYSRVYLGCHYFVDILVGVIFGYTVSKLLFLIKLKNG